MPKTLHLGITGYAEAFMDELGQREGLSDQEIIARALWMLERAYARDVGVVHNDRILGFFTFRDEVSPKTPPTSPSI